MRVLSPGLVRAEQWWEYKLVPTMCCFYATALVLQVPIASLWQALLSLLAALVPGAIYVSVTNDIADRRSDAASGKANRMAGIPGALLALMVAVPAAVGLVFCFMWRDDPLLVSAYLAAWAAFTLYSVPPFRFKAQGTLGVLADAAGAHLFPTLVAVLLAYRAAGVPADPGWLCATGAWAFAYGIRGILWHQLDDLGHDRAAGVGTFARRHSRVWVARAATFLIFPLEAAALTLVLWRVNEPATFACLLGYGAFAGARVRDGELPPVIVETRGGHSLLFHEYYDVLLPAGLLLAAAWRSPVDIFVILLHFALFPRRGAQVGKEAILRFRTCVWTPLKLRARSGRA